MAAVVAAGLTATPPSPAAASYGLCGIVEAHSDEYAGLRPLPGTVARRTPQRLMLVDSSATYAFDHDGRFDTGYGDAGIGRPRIFGTLGLGADGSAAWAGLERDEDTWEPTGRIVVERATPAGVPDTSFGVDGIATLDVDVSEDTMVPRVLVRASGQVVVELVWHAPFEPEKAELLALRPDGALDTAFGSEGVHTPAFLPTLYTEVEGELVVAGRTSENQTRLVALDQTASPTARFGGGVTLDGWIPAHADHLLAGPSGGVTLAVTQQIGTWEVTRVRSNGSLDPAWGDGGTMTVAADSQARPALHADGIVFAWLEGTSGPSPEPVLHVLRLRPDGSADPGFGAGGKAEVALQFQNGHVLDPTVDDQGRIVSGQVYALSHRRGVSLVRLLPDGQLDSDCGDGIPGGDGPLAVHRVGGLDRYDTAARLADTIWSQADTVVVATGQDFPDALTAVPAAIRWRAPILLTLPDRLPDSTARQIAGLQPNEIVVVGGPAAVSDGVAAELAQYAPVRRLHGPDRYATAAAIAAETAPPSPTHVFLATGANFADALGAGPVAAAQDTVVLLTAPTSLPEATRDALAALRPQRVVLLGGVAAIGLAVDDAARALGDQLGFAVDRIAGFDRYHTMAKLAERTARFDRLSKEEWASWNLAVAATGAAFPDALAAGAATGFLRGTLVLVPPQALNEYAREVLAVGYPRQVLLVGGPAAVSEQVRQEISPVTLGYRFLEYVEAPLAYRSDGAGGFIASFQATQRPKRWDPCRPIRWVYNGAEEPPGGFEDVQAAMAQIAGASGLAFEFAGHTDEVGPRTDEFYATDQRYGPDWPPVLVWWQAMPGDSAGQASAFSHGQVFRSGEVVIDSDGPPGLPYDRDVAYSVLLHELGHLVGLAHVGPTSAVMYPMVDLEAPRTQLTEADRRGLAHLGGCA